ncbi:MAG: arginase family protein [Oscillochloridaceae bacterium umkhey_bin13]
MPTHTPLQTLHVVGIRYLDEEPADGDICALDSYIAAAVYWEAGLPVVYEEPSLPTVRRTGETITDLGMVCAAVADEVANGLRAGRAVLVSGGNCSHCVGVFAGMQRALGPTTRIGMVWLDAHGDFNTPNTTLTGMLGGMPVAVCAGLGYARWRELAGVLAPLPTDRIVFVDVRNLDVPEEQLIRATEATIAAAAPGRPGADLAAAISDLAARCDVIYLHVDSDILDLSLTPNHITGEPGGIDLPQAHAIMDLTLATGKVAVFAVVSVFGNGEGREAGVAAGVSLIQNGMAAWKQYGMASFQE